MTVIEILPTCTGAATPEKCRKCKIRSRSGVVETRDGRVEEYTLVCSAAKAIPSRDVV